MKYPSHVVAVIGDQAPDWLDAYPDAVIEAVTRLIQDDRMKPLWGRTFTGSHLHRAAMEFDVAMARDHWTDKSQRERDLWLAKFEKTADTLLELMHEAPRTPEQWGFPARDNVLMNVAYRMGMKLPDANDAQAFFGKMLELEAAADAECWTLADALNHYREQQRTDYQAKQSLRKPGDAKAGRAQFIAMFKQATNLSSSTVATVASVMFDDETIDDRLVRRLTAGR